MNRRNFLRFAASAVVMTDAVARGVLMPVKELVVPPPIPVMGGIDQWVTDELRPLFYPGDVIKIGQDLAVVNSVLDKDTLHVSRLVNDKIKWIGPDAETVDVLSIVRITPDISPLESYMRTRKRRT